MKITNDVLYVGVDDHKVDLFEGQYDVPNGMAYNSYVIMDEKITIMDSVDANFKDEWLNNIKNAIKDKKPTYLVVLHMEPDHSANIIEFLKEYPETIVVSNAKSFKIIEQFFNVTIENKLEVKDGDLLELGKHTLKFVAAPMVHWPEVMLAYDTYDKILFSADAFGKFGANDYDDPEGWACEARRYYFGIVGKYGAQVQAVLKKLAGVELKHICSLHGPILSDNLDYYLNIYDTWSKYESETKGVFIAYASAYGNTAKAAHLLEEELKKAGVKVAIADLAREDIHESVEDAFRYDRIVLATITYNGTIFPIMDYFISLLTERGYQNKKIGIIENGSWAPMAAKVIQSKFEKSKNITFVEPVVKILSAPNDNTLTTIKELANNLK
ncbi:MAG: FprA family A-type flavoprotein [Acholeplasmatales bacterium]|nr:FprA family A-type flavoprotein [Acholeplasmatales bacterium]